MTLIEFERVTKTFSHRREARLLRHHLQESFRSSKREVFYALQDVSFRVNAGESMAVIGRNGAGKSTLLSLVSGLCEPTAGRVTTRGQVAALLELGSGFHPDLTGIENIFLYAALLGLSRRAARERLEQIVEFAGIGSFLADPIRKYSSGMVLRLAFSVAVHVDPEILIVDEVLAVGDERFQKKCLDRILDFRKRGKTLLFVSHVPELVRTLCDHAMWLDRGRVRLVGSPAGVLHAYQEENETGA